MLNFLRISRHPHRPSHVPLIGDAIAGGKLPVRVIDADMGAFGADPTASILAHMTAVAQQHGVDRWHGIEVAGPGSMLDSLGWLGCPRYRAVMARGADGRVVVEMGPDGAPLKDAAGRDVLLVECYQIVAPPQVAAAAREADVPGSEDGPIGRFPSAPRLPPLPGPGRIHWQDGRWYVSVLGMRRELQSGDYGGLYARWVDATHLASDLP